jgi:hypothetical protein
MVSPRELVLMIALLGSAVLPVGRAEAAIAPEAKVCFTLPGANGLAFVNLTPVNARGAGNAQLVPGDRFDPPIGSNVNFSPGSVDPNLAAVEARGNRVCFVNSDNTTVDVVADYLGAAESFDIPASLDKPTRVLDTRASSPIGPSQRVCFDVAGQVGSLALVNLTPVNARGVGSGQLVSSEVIEPPTTSNVNFSPGSVDPNLAAAPIGPDRKVCYVNSDHTTVDLVADELASLSPGTYTLAQPSGAPVRVLDTRTMSPVAPSGRACFAVAGTPGDVALVNLTPARAQGAGNGLLVSSAVLDPHTASNVNFTPGSVDPNLAVAPIGPDGKVCFANSNHTTVDLVADHLATILAAEFVLATPSGAPLRVVDTRTHGPLPITGSVVLSTIESRVQAIDCWGAMLCIAAGRSDGGAVAVYRSTDGGLTWSTATLLDVAGDVQQIDCTSDSTCVGVGYTDPDLDPFGRGVVFSTRDAGVAWATASYPEPGLLGVDCWSTTECLAVGFDMFTPMEFDVVGTAMISHDGGLTFTPVAVPSDFGRISTVDCPSVGTCLIGARNKPFSGGPSFIARTVDGAASWQRVLSPADSRLLHCSDALRCVNVRQGYVDITENGGTTWSQSPVDTTLTALDCASPTWCVAAGQGSPPLQPGELTGFQSFGPTAPLTPIAVAGPPVPPLHAPTDARSVTCPTADRCFVLAGDWPNGREPKWGFVTHIVRPVGG